MLSAIIIVPLLAALVIAILPRELRFGIRLVALAATLVSFCLAAAVFVAFDPDAAGYQFVTKMAWVSALGIHYHVGVDGINVGLVFMGALVGFAAACVSWEIRTREKEFYLLLLVMTAGILGAFASLDLFFFYFFHELALVPTFIMIGVWGRGRDKTYATFKITLYLSAGALVALVGLIALYLQMPAEARTFDLVEMTAWFQTYPVREDVQRWIFPLLLFGFGILVSLWPFYTWAPMGYAAAPTATAMLHAGVLKKFGLYGLIRIALPLLPQGAAAWVEVLAWLCLGNIIYCGWVAMRQKELNWLIGNSSVAHMGFIFLGVASLSLLGITGAVVLMVAHGLLAALSFGLSGWLREATGTLEMKRLGGLLRHLPVIGTAFVMAAFAGCGLPGFANFAGELMVLFAVWDPLPWFVVGAAWGALVIGAVYMLRAVRSIMHGPVPENMAAIKDANVWRALPFALLLAGLVIFGFFPKLLTSRIEPGAIAILRMAAPDRLAPVEFAAPLPAISPGALAVAPAGGER